MKLKTMISVALLVVWVAPAFASAKDSGSVSFDHPVTVATSQLPAGNYKLEWEGAGPTVEVKFLQNDKVVATAPASVEENAGPYHEGFEVTPGPNNSKVLNKIYWKNKALTFQQGVTARSY